MKRFLLILSLVLNGVLVVAIWMKPAVPTRRLEPKEQRTKVLTRTIVKEIEAPAPAPSNDVAPIASTEPFRWSSIQSTNFVEYAEKLRALGCPPQTVRDIITGEINDWILAQRRILFEPMAPRFWEFATIGRAEIPAELETAVSELKKMKADLVAAALGKLPKIEAEEPAPPRRDENLAMISDEKYGVIREIEKKYAELRKEVQKDKQLKGNDRNKRIEELEKKREAERQAALSPEELAEYKTRREHWQFQNIYGFETTEEEMRQIAAVSAKHSLWGSDPDYPADEEIRKARSKQRDDELKTLLGEKRFTEFQRGSDPAYREAFKVAKAYNLPEGTAVRAYELAQQLQAETRKLQDNPALNEEQRREMTQDLRDANDDVLAELYGEKALGALRRVRRY